MKLAATYENADLKTNCSKTKSLWIGQKQEDLNIDGQVVEICDQVNKKYKTQTPFYGRTK